MSNPVQIDINELLADFAKENAAAVQRALVAEAGIKARDRIIDELANKVVQLEKADEAEPDPTADETYPTPPPDISDLDLDKPFPEKA